MDHFAFQWVDKEKQSLYLIKYLNSIKFHSIWPLFRRKNTSFISLFDKFCAIYKVTEINDKLRELSAAQDRIIILIVLLNNMQVWFL